MNAGVFITIMQIIMVGDYVFLGLNQDVRLGSTIIKANKVYSKSL